VLNVRRGEDETVPNGNRRDHRIGATNPLSVAFQICKNSATQIG
jgi:hypothetical protein